MFSGCFSRQNRVIQAYITSTRLHDRCGGVELASMPLFGAIKMASIASESDSSPLPGHSQVTFHAHAKYWMGEWAVGAKQAALFGYTTQNRSKE